MKQLCLMGILGASGARGVEALRASLREAGVLKPTTRRLPPHITLCIRPFSDEAPLREAVERLFPALPPVPLRFGHLGLFPGGRVLFAAPEASAPLLRLHEAFAPGEDWSPHATLLTGDKQKILSALPVALSAFTPFEGRIDSLGLLVVGCASGEPYFVRPLKG